jgi:citrate lyase subunit beta/citryl-CoA lyase
MPVHPNDALFCGEKPFPMLPACEHFAGSEKLINKALGLIDEIGPLFNITCDCEDGAPAGRESEHAEMVAHMINSPANRHGLCGARIHDVTHPHWRRDVDILVGGAGQRLAYLTLPKCTSVEQAGEQIDTIRQVARRHVISREIPIHILIETHGALRRSRRPCRRRACSCRSSRP